MTNNTPAVEAALDKVQDYAGALEVARNQAPRDNHVIATMRQMLNEARAALLALLSQDASDARKFRALKASVGRLYDFDKLPDPGETS